MASKPDLGITYKSMQQLVTERIRTAILDGTFKPNEKLNQEELAKMLQVSRIPTREALRTLEGEGLIRFYPNRGAVVAAMRPDEMKDVYEIRAVLESNAAVAAIKHMTGDRIDRLKKLQRQMAACADASRWIALNDQFHLAIYEAEGTVRLLNVIGTLRNWVAGYIKLLVSDDAHRKAADKDHLVILRAVERRDAAALRSAIKNHLRTSCKGVIAALKKRKSLQAD